jgi:glycosyltransferase involved in cell wall biosynthesis
MAKVSVIIPCYNHGIYIHDAINSVLNQTFVDFEIIVVNDGSTDPDTVNILKRINNPKIKVLHTKNQGLPSARNNGIREAQAPIILPLDSDDKISPTYLEKGVDILETDRDTGIVYCNAEFFGEKRGKWLLPEYSLKEILFHNVIFHCAFFRRSDWEKLKGYNPNMKYGWEDWDFWLSIISTGKNVHRIPEVLHHYRVRKKSMVHAMTEEQKVKMHAQIIRNHQDFFIANMEVFIREIYHTQTMCHRSIFDRLFHDKLLHPVQTIKKHLVKNQLNP